MAEDNEGSKKEAAKSRIKLPLPLIAATVIAVTTGAAGGYFFAPETMVAQLQKQSNLKKSASQGDNGHKKKTGGKESAKTVGESTHQKQAGAGNAEEVVGKFTVRDGYGVYSPAQIVVSIRPSGRVRYLKLGYVVETSPDASQIFIERENRLRDTLNTYLRALDVATLEDPDFMGRIRAQLARRVSAVVEPAPVHSVLITDFILS